jgi:hypothetical protein
MWKFFAGLIEFFNWLAIFLVPFVAGVGIGFIIYINYERLLWLSIIFSLSGAITGILIAEHIRRKYGCSRYLSRIRATPEIWPDEYPEEIEGRRKEQEIKEEKRKHK